MSFPPHSTLGGMLRQSFVSPSRREGPPSIWDTWYIGKRFCRSICIFISSLSSRNASMKFVRRAAPFITGTSASENVVFKISVYWRTLSRAQDEGLRFLKTKSFAIITLRYCTRRLHCSCDFSERRSSIILRSSNHRGQHPMLCQKAFGLCSNSGSLLSRKALVAYRRRMRFGKAKQCRSAKRNEKNAMEV